MSPEVGQVEGVFRREHGRVVATLVRYFGDIDVAEDAVRAAFEVAARHWPEGAVPPNPAAWITATARYLVLDRQRREASRYGGDHEALGVFDYADPAMPAGGEPDDRLRLIFTCCHPALDRSDQVALTLRLLCGLTSRDIAQSLLVSEATITQRIVRAKRKIKTAAVRYSLPSPEESPARLDAVLTVIHLIFNDGYLADEGDSAAADLCAEAIGLAGTVADLLPDEPEVLGLLALLALTYSRRAARIDGDGSVVLLADQDRSLWDWDLIEEGQELIRECVRYGRPGPYQIQAAIQAVHGSAPSAERTDWRRILALYDMLMASSPTRVVAFNRAVALAEVEGPEAALAVIDTLDLRSAHLFHATRGDLLSRMGRHAEAAHAYQIALQLTSNPAERRFLARRLGTFPPRLRCPNVSVARLSRFPLGVLV